MKAAVAMQTFPIAILVYWIACLFRVPQRLIATDDFSLNYLITLAAGLIAAMLIVAQLKHRLRKLGHRLLWVASFLGTASFVLKLIEILLRRSISTPIDPFAPQSQFPIWIGAASSLAYPLAIIAAITILTIAVFIRRHAVP